MIRPGSKELIFIIQLGYYGDLIIPAPSWVSYAPQARITGRHVTWIQADKSNNWRLSPQELTARIAYVDFDGKKALKASQNISSDVELNQDFINSYFPKLMRAVNIISEWIKNF